MQDETTYMLEPTAFHSMTRSPGSNRPVGAEPLSISATSPPTSSPKLSICSPKW